MTDYFKVSRQDLERILGDKMVLYKNFGDRLIFAISKVIDINYKKTDKMFLMIDSLIKAKIGESQLNGKMATFLDKGSPNRTYFVTFTSSENDNTLNFFASLFATKTILDSGEKIFRRADVKFPTSYIDDWEDHIALITYLNPSLKG